MTLEYHDYYDDGAVLRAAVARPQHGRTAPVVLVAHQWAGRGAIEHAVIERIAALGYVGIAIDLFGKDVRGELGGDNTHLIAPWMENRAGLAQRVLSAVYLARTLSGVDKERVAALGYCFGGLSVLDLARSGKGGVRGVVSLHGLLGSAPALEGDAITTKVMVHHGWEDPLAPPDAVLAFTEEMTRRNADWQFHAFGHVGHAFTNPNAQHHDKGLFYDPMADQRSWRNVVDFLNEVFA